MIAIKLVKLVLLFSLFSETLYICDAVETPVLLKANIDNALNRSTSAPKTVNWVSLSSASEVLIRRPEPAGYAGPVHLFICRAFFNEHGDFRSGVLWVHNGSIHCDVGYYGQIRHYDTFEILEAAPGTTSWVPATDEIPGNAIIGGADEDGIPSYLCRGMSNGKLLVGLYSANVKFCYVTQVDYEHYIHEDLEVFVVTRYDNA